MSSPWASPSLGRILAEAYIGDLSLDRHPHEARQYGLPPLPRPPLVYTAFDGDHFAIVPLMRQHALRMGAVPVSPESVIGYKDSVDAYQDKQGVLRADLSVLDKCDELWIYTDLPPSIDSIGWLAEGVATELLWFSRARRTRGDSLRVNFVPITRIATLPLDKVTPVGVQMDSMQVEDSIHRFFPELFPFVEGVSADGLPPVTLCIHDPLDTKYADWLRAESHQKRWVPVVPALAIEVGDGYGSMPLASVLEAWVQLPRIVDAYWLFESIDGRPEAAFVSLMRAVLGDMGKKMLPHEWSDFGVPKAKFGSDWPLTGREGRGKPFVRGFIESRSNINV